MGAYLLKDLILVVSDDFKATSSRENKYKNAKCQVAFS